MIKYPFALTCLFFLSMSLLQAQTRRAYDPLLDPNVKVLESPNRTGKGEYLWYPGQLSAHLQQKRVNESGERCVNVGYPGKFYAPVYTTSFRKTFKLKTETTVEFQSTGVTRVFVNKKEVTTSANRLLLPRGTTVLQLDVTAEKDLPAIKVLLNGTASVDDWQASLDGRKWNIAETSPIFGTAGRTPLDDPEVAVEIPPVSIQPLRNAVVEADTVHIRKNGYVLVDFFHLEVGTLSFRAQGKGTVSVFVGESPEEALNENEQLFEQKPIVPYPLSESVTEIVLPERAIRYAKIVSDESCTLTDINFRAKVWPVTFQLSFECSDERINRLWDASVASLHTSTHGFYLDGIKRDYLPWSMDAVLSTFAGDYLFFDEQVSRNSLSVALMPINPTVGDLGIPDYPLHALVGFKHHYECYDNLNTLLSYRDRIEQLLQFYETIQDERGFISANPSASWGFVPGWATRRGPDRKGTPAYAQIMLYYNYKIGALFAKEWGDRKAAKHYSAKAETLKKAIFSHFWDEQQGLFYNGYNKEGNLDKTISHHAQYWAILADIFPREHYDNLFAALPKIPYYYDYVSYEKGYEFLAYAKAGRVEEMWEFLFRVFDDWLEQGHTRFPENFSYRKSKEKQLVFYNRPYGLSLCHGANGVPVVVAVLNGILGFESTMEDANKYYFNPNLMHLEWVNFEFPTKEGPIRMKLRKGKMPIIEKPKKHELIILD